MRAIAVVWLLLIFLLLVLFPLLFTQLMSASLAKLHMSPATALWLTFGIIFGGMVNIPVKRTVRGDRMMLDPFAAFGFGWHRPMRAPETVIAVNLGGCLIPTGVALYQLWHLAALGPTALITVAAVAAANIFACHRMARPVPGVGIVMPALMSPALSAVLALLLAGDYAPPVAFVAGVAGPLIGADLLHLREIERHAVGVASIGGAGTFDGIVLSGIIAAYLA